MGAHLPRFVEAKNPPFPGSLRWRRRGGLGGGMGDDMANGAIAVLGALSSELAAIRNVLVRAGIPVHQAMYAGSPVDLRHAYRADSTDPPLPGGDSVIWRVECGGPVFRDVPADRVVLIDHHRPGDPGYGRPPAEFWEASSLGRILGLLEEAGRSVPGGPSTRRFWRLAAAADHCLAAAYRGLCPGVDPDQLLRWRATQLAASQKRPVEAVWADLEKARRCLREAVQGGRVIRLDRWEIADLTDEPPTPELSEASVREGIPFFAAVVPSASGGKQEVGSGSGSGSRKPGREGRRVPSAFSQPK